MQILLTCLTDPVLENLISGLSYSRTELFPLTTTPQVAKAHEVLAIIDLGAFKSLNVSEKDVLGRLPSLLLVPTTDFSEREGLENVAGCFIFFYNPDESASLTNIALHLRTLFSEIQAVHRLNDYITDSFKDIVDSNLLRKQKEEIERLNAQLEQISRVDFLTNLLNRRALLEAFEAEKRRALRNLWRFENELPVDEQLNPVPFHHQAHGALSDHIGNFSCMIIDIDHFKLVNDQHGHLIGDVVLKRFGELVKSPGLFRDTDTVGRFGGEEFIVLLSETNSHNAAVPANRLRQMMKEVVFYDEEKHPFSVSISIGVAQFLPAEVSCDELIRKADRALYWAKEHGRDQVVVWDDICSQLEGEIAPTIVNEPLA